MGLTSVFRFELTLGHHGASEVGMEWVHGDWLSGWVVLVGNGRVLAPAGETRVTSGGGVGRAFTDRS